MPAAPTLADAQLHDWKVWAFCADCRKSRLLRLEDLILSSHFRRPLDEVAKEKRFRCDQCQGRRVTIQVRRDVVGRAETVAEFSQG